MKFDVETMDGERVQQVQEVLARYKQQAADLREAVDTFAANLASSSEQPAEDSVGRPKMSSFAEKRQSLLQSADETLHSCQRLDEIISSSMKRLRGLSKRADGLK